MTFIHHRLVLLLGSLSFIALVSLGLAAQWHGAPRSVAVFTMQFVLATFFEEPPNKALQRTRSTWRKSALKPRGTRRPNLVAHR